MTEPKTPGDFFKKRNIYIRIFVIAMIILTVLAGLHTNFKTETVFTALPRVLHWFIENVIPDARAWGRFPGIFDKLVETIFMSVMATTTAAALSLIFSLLGARSTKINGFFSIAARGVASVSRNIPVAVWAMIFLITYGMSAFTGYLALFFATFGFLTRAFIEVVDDTAGSQVEALRATGASYLHTLVQAVIPSASPQMISWMLYMVETNIRSATLVGLLTGSGIGFLFDMYYKNGQYKSASLTVMMLVVVVMGIELLSNFLRRKIL
ncbi:MAG: phosphonate ABC transporter, permease protein PhnE [Fibrobacterota bacterium]